jgi:hypothetical protein
VREGPSEVLQKQSRAGQSHLNPKVKLIRKLEKRFRIDQIWQGIDFIPIVKLDAITLRAGQEATPPTQLLPSDTAPCTAHPVPTQAKRVRQPRGTSREGRVTLTS